MNPRNSETAIETKHKREIEELILELHQAGSILSLKIQQRFELRNQVFFIFLCRKNKKIRKYRKIFLQSFPISISEFVQFGINNQKTFSS